MVDTRQSHGRMVVMVNHVSTTDPWSNWKFKHQPVLPQVSYFCKGNESIEIVRNSQAVRTFWGATGMNGLNCIYLPLQASAWTDQGDFAPLPSDKEER